MTCLITGAAGFIGSHLAGRLLAEGHKVIVVDDLSSGYEDNIPEGADFLQLNVLSTSAYQHLLQEVDVVFHNAASKKNICLIDPEYDLDVNAKGTLLLLQACKEAGVKKFVHASTGSVYGEVDGVITENSPYNPVSYYGVSKLAGERYVNLFSRWINSTILRYFHVYGSRQESDPRTGGVVAVFKRQIAEGGPLTIHGSGRQKRVFTHVDDVVEANIRAWEYTASEGRIYNCASSNQVSVMGLAGTLIGESKKNTIIRYDPPLEGDIYNFKLDNSRIKRELNMEFKAFCP